MISRPRLLDQSYYDCIGNCFWLLSAFFDWSGSHFQLFSDVFQLFSQSFSNVQFFSNCSVPFSDCSGSQFRLLGSFLRLLWQLFPIAEQIIFYANTHKSNYTVASQINNFQLIGTDQLFNTYSISRGYWYVFTLCLSLFGLPSSLPHPPSPPASSLFRSPGEPWPRLSEASSISCFIPE